MRERFKQNTGEIYSHWAVSLPLFIPATNMISRSITLTKNSQFYVRQGDVERLIAQGYLQKLS